MLMDAKPTLDQLQIFLSVAETGSFSAAARQLKRAQSVISYAISNLEIQLEVPLFERGIARQPQLTEAGRALLPDARRIVSDLHALQSRARGIQQGLEAEVTLALSTMVPADAMVETLRAFREHYPTVALNLRIGELGMVMDLVANGTADIGLGGAPVKANDHLTTEKIGYSSMIPVAAPQHPLVQLDRALTLIDVREEVQLVVTDASGLTQGRDFNVLSYRIWRVSDIHTKRLLIIGGLGWGGLPAAMVRDDITEGRLVPLLLDAYQQGEYPIYAIHRTANPPGPASRWLVRHFEASLSNCPPARDAL